MELKPVETSMPFLDGFKDETGRTYGRTDEGYVVFGGLAVQVLNQQSQYAARYVDGLLPGYPDLGRGLHLEGTSADYHTLAVAPDDAEELVHRIVAYCGLQQRRVWREEIRESVSLSAEELAQFTTFLQERELPIP